MVETTTTKNRNSLEKYMENIGFSTPPNHVKFMAKKLFGASGEIADGAIAYIQPGGGGPVEQHAHPHSHLFIVAKGEAKILMGNNIHIIHENESFLIKGGLMHSVWNNADTETVMIGITINEHDK